jgi:hypothetical protein
MSILQEGQIAGFIFFMALLASYIIHTYLAGKGVKWAYELRLMPQVEAISDGVDRAAEEGKPVYISPGDFSSLTGTYAIMTIAGMNVMRYTAAMCVRRGVKPRMIVPWKAEILPLMQGIYKEVCVSEGRPEVYDIDDVVYYGGTFRIVSAGWSADVLRTDLSCMIIAGAMSGGGSLSAIGWAKYMDCTLIGGSGRFIHQGTWAMLGDYPLFCEDIYAAGAYCSGRPDVQAAQVAADPLKYAVVAVLALFAVLGQAFPQVLSWLTL